MIEFDLEVKEVTIKRLDDSYHKDISEELMKLENLKYKLQCKSPKK